jgi:hypothetical protein
MTQLEKVLYTAKAHTTGGRDGAARSDDGRLDIKLSSPGTSGGGTNPEQLFAAGYAACFMSALSLVARRAKVGMDGASVTGEVDEQRAGPRAGTGQHRGQAAGDHRGAAAPFGRPAGKKHRPSPGREQQNLGEEIERNPIGSTAAGQGPFGGEDGGSRLRPSAPSWLRQRRGRRA